MAGAYTVAIWLSKVIDNWNGIVADGLENARELAVDLNLQQLQQGIKKTGQRITPPYARLTVLHKQARGMPTYPTLKETGEYYSKWYLKISGTTYTFGSSDWKAPDLEKKYTTDIYGLTSESRRILWVEQLRKEVINIIKAYR